VKSEPGPAAAGTGGRGQAGGPRRHDRLVAVAAYLALFLFGLLQGVIGGFQYSRGPGPLVAVLFDLAILVTCLLAAWGMRSPGGGLMPGAGWFVAAFVLATGTQGGSVLISNTTAGQWFLFGGAGCAAVGCILSYLRWSRAGLGGQAGGPPRKAGR
jgi:hypothetical protein